MWNSFTESEQERTSSSCTLVIWCVINPWFYGWLYVSQREGNVFLRCPDWKSHSQRVLTCSVSVWWNLPCRGINFHMSCLHIMFNKFCALNIFKGCFCVKLFWMDGLRVFGVLRRMFREPLCCTSPGFLFSSRTSVSVFLGNVWPLKSHESAVWLPHNSSHQNPPFTSSEADGTMYTHVDRQVGI